MARLFLIFFFMAGPVYSWTTPEPRDYWIVSKDASTLYGATDFHGNYKIAQWSIPEELPVFRDNITENDHMRVVWDKQSRTTRLTLRGNDLPCNDELDAYLSPLAMVYSDFLNKYKRIRLFVSIKREDVFVSSFGCDITQGGDLVGIILFNEKSRQKLFYQLRFSNIRMNPDLRYWWRNGMQHPDGWVSWGYRDQLRSYGENAPGVGLWETYDLNLSRRIKKLIKARSGMDHDLSHWKIKSIYHGSHIWGDMEISTSWKNVKLIAR